MDINWFTSQKCLQVKNNGVKAHYKCEHCGKLFLDDKALKEVNEADLVINALPRKTLEKITPDLLSIINAYKTDLSLNNYYVEINVNNGAKILTDYEDDFFYEYSEETVGVQSLTFTIDGDRIINIGINYCDSIQNVKTIKQKTTTRINEIVSKAKAISDETEKINAVATEIWSNYEDDFTGRDVHTNDAYGCLVLGYADKFGAASAFQAVMKRLGYSGGYYYDKTNSSVYSKTIINGKTLYTSISNDRSRKNNSYTLIEKKETNWTYKDMPLKTAEYTPISAFRDNPYLNLYDENAVYFRDKVLANEKTFTLPNEIYVNYKVGTGSYTSNIRHEYPELTFLFRSVSTYMKDNHLVITVDYLYPEARDTMLKEYYAERDKIVSRAKLLKTDTEKVIFVNNYLCKLAKYVSEAQNAHKCMAV